MFENVDKSQIPELFEWTLELGGYFRRWRGGVLARWIEPDSPSAQAKLDLEARATLAFFEVCMTADRLRILAEYVWFISD